MVTVYSKPKCVQCSAVIRRLDNKNIPYRKVDISTDEAAFNHVASLGYQSVPVVETADGEHFQGYDPAKIDALM